jgi:invasion protein IalB
MIGHRSMIGMTLDTLGGNRVDPGRSGRMAQFGRQATSRRATRFGRGPLVAGAALALAAMVPASAAFAQGAVKNTYGEWQMRCETPAGAKVEQCALVQSVQAEDKPNVTLVVIVLKTADGKSRLLRVIAPLGVLLPSGLGLKIDSTDVGRAGFVRCMPSGCIAEVVMDDDLLRKLSTGQQATFIVFQTPEEGIGIPVSLNGFGKAYESLP